MTDRCDPEAESGPDGRVRLVSTSRASDGSFTAISEIGALLRDEQHRLIGGVAIVLHQHRLGPAASFAPSEADRTGGLLPGSGAQKVHKTRRTRAVLEQTGRTSWNDPPGHSVLDGQCRRRRTPFVELKPPFLPGGVRVQIPPRAL